MIKSKIIKYLLSIKIMLWITCKMQSIILLNKKIVQIFMSLLKKLFKDGFLMDIKEKKHKKKLSWMNKLSKFKQKNLKIKIDHLLKLNKNKNKMIILKFIKNN